MEQSKNKPPLDPRLLNFARNMRRDSTDAEARLWHRLRDRQLGGFKFRRQVVIAGFVIDFYCSDACLAVELDGSQHMESPDAEYDRGRTMALEKIGVRVLRFWDN